MPLKFEENPFFRRDLRALGRRHFAPVAWPLLVQTLLLLLPLALLELAREGRLSPPDTWRGLALVLLGLGHAATCGASGWLMGSRVFVDEHRQRTLEGLRLVAQHPFHWLRQKLVLPVYVLLLVWAAAAPLYAAVTIRGHFVPSELQPGSLLALCAGLLSFGSALLAPPEGFTSPFRHGRRAARGVLIADLMLLGLPAFIGVVLLRMAGDWMFYALGLWDRPYSVAPFFGASLSTVHGLSLLLAAFSLTALGAAYATAHPEGRLARPARLGGRLAGVLTGYVVCMGYVWDRSFSPGFVLFAAAALVLAAAAALPSETWERGEAWFAGAPGADDRLARREVALLARLLDNAVFFRDLRVALRRSGLTRQFLLCAGGIALAAAFVGGFAAPFLGGAAGGVGGGAGLVGRMGAGALVVGSWLILPALLAYGGRSLGQWHTERRCGTLSQVFATPMPTRSLVLGRWGAALLVGTARALPVPLAMLLGAVALQAADLSQLTAQGLWLASLGMGMSAGLAGSAHQGIRLADLLCAGCLGVYAVMVEGAVFLWLWSQAPVVNGVPDRSALAVFALWMLPINALFTAFLYRRAVADVEEMRRLETT